MEQKQNYWKIFPKGKKTVPLYKIQQMRKK